MSRDVVATVDAPLGAGIGLRLPHLSEVAATRPAVSWYEVHAENFLANPHAHELLLNIAQHTPISLHTVGVSVGSAHGLDEAHLHRVAQLVEDVQPVLVSGHLAWSTHEGEYLNDLLPMPYTEESLDIVARHVDRVQSVLQRAFVLENPSSYVGFADSTMREPEFLNRLAARTGCQLLCDVSNIVVSAANLQFDAQAYVRELDFSRVAELHLGGFSEEPDESSPNGRIIIDTHSCVVDDRAWDLYRQVIALAGPRPTLIEWDNEIPAIATLIAESQMAQRVLDACILEATGAAR